MADVEPITTFVVTDIEADGPSPLGSSMLSFASVACDVTGRVLGEFEAVLEPRSDRKPSPDTMEWWKNVRSAAKKMPAANANVRCRRVRGPRRRSSHQASSSSGGIANAARYVAAVDGETAARTTRMPLNAMHSAPATTASERTP